MVHLLQASMAFYTYVFTICGGLRFILKRYVPERFQERLLFIAILEGIATLQVRASRRDWQHVLALVTRAGMRTDFRC